MNIRTRRLKRDHELVLSELAQSEFVTVEALSGDPPTHYLATYRLSGVRWGTEELDAVPITEHQVDIHLPLGYPKQGPRCTMRTPIWHPNIGDYVCIGDFWSAGVTLVDIIAHIGDMIQYKSYNLKSPVNKAAAVWAQKYTKSFPVGTRDILPPDSGAPQRAARAVVVAPPPEMEVVLGPVRDRQG